MAPGKIIDVFLVGGVPTPLKNGGFPIKNMVISIAMLMEMI
jgi:hypothetical protein